jgi:DNA repair protein SbcD/Mre11
MRILHFADVHLDRPFVGLPQESARRRRRELFDAFRRCLALAREREVDLVTIGGDLWEEEHVQADTRRSVAHELSQLDVPVLIVCGNHDPLRPGGSYLRTAWPDNVTIVAGRRLHEHRNGDVSVWAVSWGAGELTERMLESVQLDPQSGMHLLLIHGTARGAAFESEAYFPFDAAAVERAGFALCLAGHVHCAVQLGRVVYPGSPEPLGWGEADGDHCAAVVECAGRRASVELVPTNVTRYAKRELDCTGCGSSAEVDDKVRRVLVDDDAGSLFLRLRLVGEVSADCALDAGRIAAAHGDRYRTLVVVDRTGPLLDIAARADRPGLEGLFVRKLRERIEAAAGDDERRRSELALEAGLRAMDGREDVLRVD